MLVGEKERWEMSSTIDNRQGLQTGADSHTRTRTPAYPWLVPARVSVPVSIISWTLGETEEIMTSVESCCHESAAIKTRGCRPGNPVPVPG